MDTLRTVLEHARRKRSVESVPLSQIRNKDGQSPLYLALLRYKDFDFDEMLELLLEYGALVDAADNDGNTPLAWAIDVRYFLFVELFLRYREKNESAEHDL